MSLRKKNGEKIDNPMPKRTRDLKGPLGKEVAMDSGLGGTPMCEPRDRSSSGFLWQKNHCQHLETVARKYDENLTHRHHLTTPS